MSCHRRRRGEPLPLAASAATCCSRTASPAIQMKCHSCLASKKWLKSPHNRFKSASKQARRISGGSSRSQKTIRVSSTLSSPPPLSFLKQTIAPQNRKLKLAIGILFILNLAVTMYAAAASASNITSTSSSSQIRSAASQQVATSTNLPTLPAAPKKATTRRSPPGMNSRLENEDEVDLLRPVINQPIEQVRHANSQPHIYRIRAAPLNGKLSLPAPSSIRQIQMSDALIGHKRPLQVAKQADKAAPLQTTTTMDSPQDTTTSANFGIRAGSPRQVISTAANQRSHQHQHQQDHEHCKQPSEDNHELDQSGGSSIAASSPTLRLTGANRTVTQLIGSQPDVKASIASARSAPNAGSGSTQAGRFRESPGEVEELPSRDFEVRFGVEPSLLQTIRTKPTLISARASTSGSATTSQPPVRSNSSPLRLTSSFAETSLATESLNADSNDHIGSESRPTSGGGGVGAGGTDSILSLINDFDSKIITNRTKAQLSCDSGEMILRLNFSEPFKGIVYPDHNRLSPCRFFGDGHHNYELRLPLRGCGTRQAAPRVFVNDVIVRFHKTLELEEDEVKTLICRYPPPLASIPLESSGGGQVATSAANSSSVNNNNNNNNNSPGNGPQAAPGELPNEHLDGQFEFVDPNSGRVRPEPGSSGHIETISENLVVAPSGGQQHQQFGTSLNPYLPGNSNSNNNNNNNRLNANIRQQSNQATPVDLFNQRNSFSSGQGNNAFGMAETTATNQLQQQNYFERLSSIELLFLISSLMFLVLLTLGLIGSFYCFRRQANRNSDQRASAILKRKRRYLSPGAAALSGPTLHQYQSQRGGRHTGTLAPISASPSPGSDLSNRGLLAGSSSSLSVGPAGQHYNRAYQPEPPSGNLQRYLAAAAAAAGGPHYASQFATNLGDYHQQQHPRGIVRVPLIDPVGQLKRPQPPVLGRRDTTVYGHLQNGATIQRGHKRHLSPVPLVTGGHGHSQAKLRGATTFTSGAQVQPDMDLPVDGQPLLLPYTVGPQYLHPDQHYRNRATLRAKLQPAAPGQLVSAQYALVNKPQHQSRFAMDQQVYDDHHAHYKQQQQQQRQLWRAKSLSSVQQVGEDMHELGGRKSRPIIGGTLSRHEQAISGKRHRYLVPAERGQLRGEAYEASLQFSNGSSGSYSESEPEFEQNNNEFRHRNGDQQQPPKVKPKPTILLKSIEDSYITNLTEIHEQEYMKRDTMRPLSMGSWRAMQPERNRGKPGKNYDNDNDNDNDDDDHHQNERSGSERDREEEEGEEEQRYPSAQTNLRSLTELDVNFARSPESGKSSTLRPTVSMDQVGAGIGATGSKTEQFATRSHKKKMEDQMGSTNTPERSISVPDVGALRDEQESPDLILSPDYDYDRLELKPEAGRSSPHNSVSYV